MDPVLGALIGIGGQAARPPSSGPVGPSRSDGYALGGQSDSRAGGDNSGAASSAAYGGAWSNSSIDGSNWVVTTGIGTSTNATNSRGEDGGFSPSQNVPGPQSPLLQPFHQVGQKAAMSMQSSGSGLLIGLGILAYLLMSHK